MPKSKRGRGKRFVLASLVLAGLLVADRAAEAQSSCKVCAEAGGTPTLQDHARRIVSALLMIQIEAVTAAKMAHVI